MEFFRRRCIIYHSIFAMIFKVKNINFYSRYVRIHAVHMRTCAAVVGVPGSIRDDDDHRNEIQL